MKKKLLAIMYLAVALTITGCGQASADSTYEKEIEELESENEELKKEIKELKAQLYDQESIKAEQTEETSEFDGFVAETSGVCGADLKWEYGNGILRISGTGKMTEFYYDEIPWKDLEEKIVHVYIESGCTEISNYAFIGCRNISKILLPSSLKSIYIASFGTEQELTIEIPDDIQYFEVAKGYSVEVPADGTEVSEDYLNMKYKEKIIGTLQGIKTVKWVWRGNTYTSDEAEAFFNALVEAGVEYY